MTREPSRADALADELVKLTFEAQPIAATVYGIPGYDDRLGDPSAAAEQELRARAADIAARATEKSDVDETDTVTLAVVAQQARTFVDRIDSHLAEYTITDLFIAPASGLLTLLPMIQLTTPKHAEDYLTRLRGLPAYLEAVAERHREGVAAGRVPVEHLVQAAISHLDRYLAAPEQDSLRRPAAPEEVAGTFTAERDRLLTDVVHPAFAAYRQVLADEIRQHARPAEKAGLSWLPGGDEMYAALSRVHTTTDRTPDELHQTGLDLMAGVHAEFAEIGQRVFGTSDITEIFGRLRTDPELRWTSGDELIASARAAISKAEAVLPQWFGRLPSHSCRVEAVPEAEAPGAPMAYYMAPAMDGSRPGTYFANTYQPQERFRHTSEVTAFHEAVPGHHLQLAISRELTDLPLLRRIADVNAYTEGWGLYCERLAAEMGLYTGDVDRLGMLAMDAVRAGRLVVDTGMHAKGWSRAEAVDYLVDNVPMPKLEINTEIDRYIAYPGQALSYMVGRLEIQRLRQTAERALGSGFDVREFHDLVIGGGPLPLTVLDQVVTDWVTT